MKTFLKVAGIVLLVVVALVVAGVSYLSLEKPAQRPAMTERVEPTPERLARGKYLVHHVTMCVDCHSDHANRYGMPIKTDRLGAHGIVWDKKVGFPGTLAASNITPDPETGIGNWTDGEILRAMREGIDRNGNALFAIMPYLHFRHLSDDDAKAIVAYIRTLPPIKWQKPARTLDPPMNFIVKLMPKPLDGAVPPPNASDRLAYGKYLANVGLCVECHTPKDDKGQPIPGRDLAGGWEMKTPNFRVVTANLTPHPDTWMGKATKEEFIGRFRSFANFTAENAPQAPPGRNTIMPWISYSGMTDEDLGAIYDYLKSAPPIENRVNPFPDAK